MVNHASFFVVFLACATLTDACLMAKGHKNASHGHKRGNFHGGNSIGRGNHYGSFGFNDLLFLTTDFLPIEHGHPFNGPPLFPMASDGFPPPLPIESGPPIVPLLRTDRTAYERQMTAAFSAGQYEDAIRLCRHALIENPRQASLHEFLAQALLAVGDYRGATMALSQATSLATPDRWGQIVSNHAQLYQGRDYAVQLQRLSRFIDAYPAAADAWALRAYHEFYLHRTEAARRDVAQALKLDGGHVLATRLSARLPQVPAAPEVEQLPPLPGQPANQGRVWQDHSSRRENDSHLSIVD